MTGNGNVVLATEALVAGYTEEVDILRGCSIELRDGELVVVIGPNGAGKSTLMKGIFGVSCKVRSGRVLLHGEDITGRVPHEITGLGMSYVPQVANVFPTLTVEENLALGGVLKRGEIKRRSQEMYEMFPRLGERRSQRAGTMSGGERQMLAMGRALMSSPRVLLLDEPSAGLAPQAVGEVFSLIKRINATGLSVLMIEQNARRALAIADRGYVLEGGQERIAGTGQELLNDPQVAELYLGGVKR